MIKVGDYVHASRWSDQDPNDPWCIGYVTEIIDIGGKNMVVVGEYSGRRWSNFEKITGDEGYKILRDRGAI